VELLGTIEMAVLTLLRTVAASGTNPQLSAGGGHSWDGSETGVASLPPDGSDSLFQTSCRSQWEECPVRRRGGSVKVSALKKPAWDKENKGLAGRLHALLAGGHGNRKALQDLRLLRFLAILDSVHGLLAFGRHATPRELFYSHVSLFERQTQSNDILKVLCRDLKVPRHCLRLVGTAKGLVRGHLRLLEPSAGAASSIGGDCGAEGALWVDCLDPLEPRGHSISPACAHIARAESMARTVIVAEKETIFLRLLDEGLLERQKPCILVTGRGFPDVATRYLLRRIRVDCAAPRVLVLVDFDVYGLSIAATYAFGPEDQSLTQDDLALPDVVPLLCADMSVATRFGLGVADTMPLTPRDHSVGQGLLRRLTRIRARWGNALIDPWEQAVRAMLEGGVKYEADALGGLSDLVDAGVRGGGGGGGDESLLRAFGAGSGAAVVVGLPL